MYDSTEADITEHDCNCTIYYCSQSHSIRPSLQVTLYSCILCCQWNLTNEIMLRLTVADITYRVASVNVCLYFLIVQIRSFQILQVHRVRLEQVFFQLG